MLKFAAATIAAEVVFAGAFVAAGMHGMTGTAYAMTYDYPSPGHTVTVDGRDYPVCAVEDCSDQPGQVGVWFDPDTGNAWLSVGERSYPVVR